MGLVLEVLEKFVSTLDSDSTVQTLLGGSGRVLLSEPEKARVLPSIILRVISDSPEKRLDAPIQFHLRISLRIFHTSWADAFALLDRVDALFLHKPFSTATFRIAACWREGAKPETSKDSLDAARVKGLSAEFVLRANKAA